MRHPPVRSRASLAVLTVAALSAFGAAYAQDKAKPPPPAWHQGKPPSMDASQLAPHAGKMTETARGEVPVSKINLPPGFSVQIWATGLPGGRAMVRGDQVGSTSARGSSAGCTRSPTTATAGRSASSSTSSLSRPGSRSPTDSLYVMAINRVLRLSTASRITRTSSRST